MPRRKDRNKRLIGRDGDRNLRVRSVARSEPDNDKIANALVAMAIQLAKDDQVTPTRYTLRPRKNQ